MCMTPSASAATGNWTDAGNYNTVAVGNITIKVSGPHLAGLAVQVNAGKNYLLYTVTLGCDIDLSAHNWVPMGNYPNSYEGTFKWEWAYDFRP